MEGRPTPCQFSVLGSHSGGAGHWGGQGSGGSGEGSPAGPGGPGYYGGGGREAHPGYRNVCPGKSYAPRRERPAGIHNSGFISFAMLFLIINHGLAHILHEELAHDIALSPFTEPQKNSGSIPNRRSYKLLFPQL